jgi:AraC family transcriptional regulator of adaptative response / DNA-3-methyladenine glycosylase II
MSLDHDARGRALSARDARSGEQLCLLRYMPPFDWPAMLSFLRRRAIAGIEIVSGDMYARTIEMDGAQGTVSVRPAEGDALLAMVRFPEPSALPAIIARLRRVFDLDTDPSAVAARLSLDPALAALVAARPGLRVPGAWDGFELAVRAVLGQQITVRAAIGLAGKLVAAYGEPLTAARHKINGLTHLFPRPTNLTGFDMSTLGMPGARAAALSSLAAKAALDPQLLGPRRSLEEAISHLRALSGVGEWTAHYIAMRGLREPDAFPAADVGLMRAMEDLNGRRPSARELLARAERWRPFRAYAAEHLWTSLGALR